jgi:peptidoglycan hydrolase-like protein with peptidoglycan-binding domain
MSAPLLNPVSIGTALAAFAAAGAAYAVTRRPERAAAAGALGAAAVLGYYKVIEPGRYLVGVVLKEGDTGFPVSKAQQRLIKHGYPPLTLELPGSFTKHTKDAVIAFQRARNLPATGVIDSATWHALIDRPRIGISAYSTDDIIAAVRRLGYTLFDDGRWNIIGIRSAAVGTNAFDDELHILRRTPSGWEHFAYPITTDPGSYYLRTPMNGTATAAVAPGQYPDSHGWGRHKGQYEALVQVNPVRVYRDGNRDTKVDFDTSPIVSGTYGINIHKSGANSTTVDRWSAGCQVFARERDFADFLNRLKQSGQRTFTYTLLTAAQM